MGVNILLVDDHHIFRQGLAALLGHQPDLKVIGEAANGRLAVAAARELHPDLVVMDVSMPVLNGIDAARQLLLESPKTRVLALSAFGDRKMVAETLRAGAAGYLLKDSAVEELVQAVRTVMAGQTYLSARIANVVFTDYVHGQGDGNGNGMTIRLSGREREVLQLMAEGKATKEVAAALGVSVKTAETHRRSIMEKLDLYSVAELTKYAIREGLTTLEC